jgi:uncharacterized membrane protein YsdA (DUF1294 family)
MLAFRHKTRKPRFRVGMPLLVVLDIGLGALAVVAWPELGAFLAR